jgi:hypothetical protein
MAEDKVRDLPSSLSEALVDARTLRTFATMERAKLQNAREALLAELSHSRDKVAIARRAVEEVRKRVDRARLWPDDPPT